MFSIKERKNKDGSISYNILVKIIAFDGSEIQKSKTWKPDIKLTDKQLQLKLKRIAREFEEQVKECYEGKTKPIATRDSFFNDVAKLWLENIKKKASKSYYASAQMGYSNICCLMESYRINDLTPIAIENIYKQIEDKKYDVKKVSSKPILEEIIKEKYGYKCLTLFSQEINIPKWTLKDAIHRDRTSFKTAETIAKGLGFPVEELFNIEALMRPYKSAYYEQMKKTIRCTLAYAVKLGIVEKNFASKLYLTTRHKDTEKIRSLTKEEVRKLMEQCQKADIRKKTAILFLLMTGVRKGELCGLNWSDFDFENKTVKISRQYESVSGAGLFLTKPKTSTSEREFELPDCIIEILKEYRLWYDSHYEKVGEKWEGVDDAVFVGRYGKRLHPTTTRNWFDEILKEAGIKHYCVHSLRHTNVTILLDSNVPVVTVSQRVGHAKSSTTLNVYADYLAESDREASNRIGDYFEKTVKNAL